MVGQRGASAILAKGKSTTWPPAQSDGLPLLPFEPDQKAVRQHHQYRIAMKALPQSTLVLIPVQEVFDLLVKLLDSVAPVSPLHHPHQGRAGRTVGPQKLGAARTIRQFALSNQSVNPATALTIDSPTPNMHNGGYLVR